MLCFPESASFPGGPWNDAHSTRCWGRRRHGRCRREHSKPVVVLRLIRISPGFERYRPCRRPKIEYRWANEDINRLPELAADFVRRQVLAIAAIASGVAARAAKDATDTIPIVFGFGLDPVKLGLVASLNQPGGNVTGITSLASQLFGKQLGILHEILPQATHIGVLGNPNGAQYKSIISDTQTAASALGQTLEILTASTANEIDGVFARLSDGKRVQALLVTNDPIYIAQRNQIAALAELHVLPAIYPFREMATAGGLVS
jgi:putative tryptophan/tyrosine transport system substrate-binding protein